MVAVDAGIRPPAPKELVGARPFARSQLRQLPQPPKKSELHVGELPQGNSRFSTFAEKIGRGSHSVKSERARRRSFYNRTNLSRRSQAAPMDHPATARMDQSASGANILAVIRCRLGSHPS